MSVFLIPEIEFLTRTRDVVRTLRRLPVSDRSKKRLMAEWFQQHRRAARTPGSRREAYNLLLGRAGNKRLIG
jgi:hypothetical protein